MTTQLKGWTHDPLTGEPCVRVEPESHPRALAMKQMLTGLSVTEACEAVLDNDGKTCVVKPMKRSAVANINITAGLYKQGRISAQQAISRIPLTQFMGMLGKQLTSVEGLTEIGKGTSASVGAATGFLALTADEAVKLAAAGKPPVLYVEKTVPEDMAALDVAVAIVTSTGGFASHAAIVARQKGRPCIVSVTHNDVLLVTGDPVTVDGTNGVFYTGAGVFTEQELTESMRTLLVAADNTAKLHVYANADTAEDVKQAVANGAKGVGLCRTEHTFFTEQGILWIQKYILATKPANRAVALNHIHELQQKHFTEFFYALGARPATIRLLDPPLHEFLPKISSKEELKAASKKLGITQKLLVDRIKVLHEENPMLGHRGCRLAITMPELYRTQVNAIVNAAIYAHYKGELNIMLPFIVDVREMSRLRSAVQAAAKENWDSVPKVKIGAMLETPRACLHSYALAEHCEFFSFGTNDLTQATWMLSRDDSAKFLPAYEAEQIVSDPFATLDLEGVGALMAHAVESLGERRQKVSIGICGEHGGEPKSIVFCHELGLDYVSCSPPQVLRARIAAAHAAIKEVDVVTETKIELPAAMLEEVPIATLKPKPSSIGAVPITNATEYPMPPALHDEFAVAKFAAPTPPPAPSPPLSPSWSSPTGVSGPYTVASGPSGLQGFKIPTKYDPNELPIDPPAPPPIVPKPQAATTAHKPLDGAFEVPPPPPIPTLPLAGPLFSGKPDFHADTAAAVFGKTTPSWITSAAPATPHDIATAKTMGGDLNKVVAVLAGKKVTIKQDGPGQPEWGVVVGYVQSPYVNLVVLAVSQDGPGHDGKNLKGQIKWQIKSPSAKLWFAVLSAITG